MRAIAALALVFAAGCTNLAAVREFADVSSASVPYPRLVREYVTQPERRMLYVPERGAVEKRAALAARAKQRRAQEPALLLDQHVLHAYLEAMARLAADETVDFTGEYQALATAAAGARAVSASDADAAATLASLLTQAATDAWRRRRLRALITEANPAVQQLVTSLRTILRAFRLDLQNEQAEAEAHYETVTRESRDPAGIAALHEWRTVRLPAIARSIDELAAYDAVLEKIARGHQQLFDDRDRLASADTARQAAQYAREVLQARAALDSLRE